MHLTLQKSRLHFKMYLVKNIMGHKAGGDLSTRVLTLHK